MRQQIKLRIFRIFSFIMASIIFFSSLSLPVNAASSSLPDLSNKNIYFKQTGSYCTLDSLAMVFRRKAILDGNENWKIITESSMKKGNWSDSGLANESVFKKTSYGLNMTSAAKALYSMKNNNYKRNPSPAKVISELKKQLDKHPEGIVIYVYQNYKKNATTSGCKWQHAVLLTGYNGNTFYCVDPAKSAASGIINLQNSILTDSKHANTKSLDKLFSYAVKIWYVSSSANKATKEITSQDPVKEITVTTPTIKVTQYPTNLTSGSSFSIRGTISSKNKITSVKGYILDSKNKTVQSTTENPNSKSLNIRNLKVNQKLLFGKLSSGNYTLKIVAKDASGGSKTWTQAFTVTTPTKININFTQYPKSIAYKKSYSLRGTISSNYKINSIQGYILNSQGVVVQSTTDTPNAKSANIRSLRLNQKMYFGKLAKGKYTLKVVIKVSSGKSKTWSKTFTVK